jgi:hypothetical protein
MGWQLNEKDREHNGEKGLKFYCRCYIIFLKEQNFALVLLTKTDDKKV